MLYFEIFKLDWLFIDTIIIILLLSILLIVKIFKFKSRWRFSFSNTSLSKIKIKSDFFKNIDNVYSVKNINIIRKMNLKDSERSKFGIINFMLKSHSKLNHLIAKGLSSYGFDVINLKIRISNANCDLKEEENQIEIKKLINSLNMILQVNNITLDSYLLILNPNSKFFAFKKFLEHKNHLIIFINPHINKMYKKTILRFLLDENINQKYLVIFSKKKLFLFSNKNMKKILNLIPDYEERNLNIKIVEKSPKSFKYYETILLGIIIDFLESNI